VTSSWFILQLTFKNLTKEIRGFSFFIYIKRTQRKLYLKTYMRSCRQRDRHSAYIFIWAKNCERYVVQKDIHNK